MIRDYDSSGFRISIILTVITLFMLCSIIGGEVLGKRLKKIVLGSKNIDKLVSALLATMTFTVFLWLGSSILMQISNKNITNMIKNSSVLDKLPHTPGFITEIGTSIFAGSGQQTGGGYPLLPSANLPTLTSFSDAISKDYSSVVQISSLGCGGSWFGTGFVVGPGLIATNAHVVAGMDSVKVDFSNSGSFPASTVLFDPKYDIAILRTIDPGIKALTLNTQIVSRGTKAIVIGYPLGGVIRKTPAAILGIVSSDQVNVTGGNSFVHNIYQLQANLQHGNSGSPIITSDGSVVAVAFALSRINESVSYAVPAQQVAKDYNSAIDSFTPVGMTQCIETPPTGN
jgi:S1-C subfamily serine protease